MCEKRGLRKGAAKIQFISCSERIAELRGIGLDIRAIYTHLVMEKQVTMTYSGFYENFTQRQQKRSRKKRTEIVSFQPALTQPTPETHQAISRPAPAGSQFGRPPARAGIDAETALRRLSEDQAQRQDLSVDKNLFPSTRKDI